MTFNEIYSRVIEQWGEVVDFSDGIFVDLKPPIPGVPPGFYCKLFIQQWNRVEQEVGHEDTYGDLMVWTLYQVFHRHAKELFRRDIFSLHPQHISKQEIEKQYFANLNENSWEKELAGYERTVS